MSELINSSDNRAAIRWKLLTSASALVLTLSSVSAAKADDVDHPQLWIELGGQAETVSGQGEIFTPAFLAANPNSSVLQKVTPLQAQQPSKFSFGEDGKLLFQPEGSDWVLSAAIRYGRSSSSRLVHHQTYNSIITKYVSGVPKHGTGEPRDIDSFSDTQARRSESHTVLDFMAGKDVGLGIFGRDSSSTLNFGVRFAQFASGATFSIRARPEIDFKYHTFPTYHLTAKIPYYQNYHATGHASRSFKGVGPSLSWTGATPFVGNPQDGEMTFDWGVNAALLFGRQKARVQHQESEHYVNYGFILNGGYYTRYPAVPQGRNSSRSVTVPNVGGSVGLSWRVQDFKVSMGYRADFFFGAMDTGIDARKSETLGFKGPYASISIGLGD